MKFIPTEFEGLFLIQLDKKGDERGWFMRTYSKDLFNSNIPNYSSNWVQMNHSYNRESATWRGLHFQFPPYQETKLVRCISGKVLDFVVDLRKDSKTLLKTFCTELSPQNSLMLFIPKGFAHGFLTLEKDSELLYLHDEYYNPDYESGLRYDDPLIKINIDFNIHNISERDKSHKLLEKNFKGF